MRCKIKIKNICKVLVGLQRNFALLGVKWTFLKTYIENLKLKILYCEKLKQLNYFN